MGVTLLSCDAGDSSSPSVTLALLIFFLEKTLYRTMFKGETVPFRGDWISVFDCTFGSGDFISGDLDSYMEPRKFRSSFSSTIKFVG